METELSAPFANITFETDEGAFTIRLSDLRFRATNPSHEMTDMNGRMRRFSSGKSQCTIIGSIEPVENLEPVLASAVTPVKDRPALFGIF